MTLEQLKLKMKMDKTNLQYSVGVFELSYSIRNEIGT